MEKYNFDQEKEFDPIKHVEKKLGLFGEGDVSIACWEPGRLAQIIVIPKLLKYIFALKAVV